MVCEHCGAEVEDDALICFECGAPIGDDPAQSGLHKLPEHLRAPVTVQLPAIARGDAATTAPGEDADRDAEALTATCPQCGAPCAPTAKICFECGAPLGVDSPRTGPLKIPDYLKAPITIELPVIITSGKSRAVAARTRWSLPRPSRRETVIAGIILAATLLFVLAGAVVVQYRVAPAAVPLRAVYHDPRHRFAFTLPGLWDETRLADGVRLTDASGTSYFELTADPALDLDAASDADFLAQPYALATVPPVQISGVNWEQRAGRSRGADGVLRERVVLATIYQGTLYAMQFGCPDSVFADLNVQVYQPLLQSFTFAT